MSEWTFTTFNQQFINLLDAKEHTQALKLLEKAQAAFPEQIYHLTYWQIGMRALMGNQEEALQMLREALEQGNWYEPDLLRSDPGFASLQALPAFQEMIEICRQRQAECQARARPELLVRQPAGRQEGEQLPLLIGLHGNGSTAARNIEYWSGITARSWLLAIPQSSQLKWPGAYGWDDRERAINEIRDHLTMLTGAYAINAERVVLGGYSMGGGLALWMAVHQSIKTSGFVVCAPYLSETDLEALPAFLETQKPAARPRGVLLVGEDDHMGLEVSHKVAEIMEAHDLPCKREILPGLGHSYPEDFAEQVLAGLAFIEQS